MEKDPPQGTPKFGKCSGREAVVEFNTPPQSGSGDTLVRSESITVTN